MVIRPTTTEAACWGTGPHDAEARYVGRPQGSNRALDGTIRFVTRDSRLRASRFYRQTEPAAAARHEVPQGSARGSSQSVPEGPRHLPRAVDDWERSEEHTSELQSHSDLV